MTAILRLAIPIAVGALALAPTASYAAWSASGSGQSQSLATSVNQANAPTATRGATTVGLSWTGSTLTSGTAVGSYDVLRHVGATTTVACSGVTTTTCTDTSPLPGAVQYGVVARVGNNWVGVESPLTAFTFDATAPTTTFATSPAAPNGTNGWYTSNVGVTLTATDPGGALASGVQEIRYSLNGGSTVVVPGGTASFTVSQEQVSSITYWAVDNAGNSESPANAGQVKLDKTAAVSTITPASSPTVWRTSPSVSISASDVTSGASQIRYKVDGAGSYTTYAGAFTVTDGSHTVAYHAVDAAGNAEVERTATIKVDSVAPTSSASPASGTTPLSVTISAGDGAGTSGVASIGYKLDGAGSYTVVAGASAVVAIPAGAHTLTYRAVDNAGNIESDRVATYAAGDVTGPAITPTAPVDGGSYTTSTANNGWARVCNPSADKGHVCAVVADASGVQMVTYNLRGTAGTNSGKCWDGTAWVNGSACSATTTQTVSTWHGSPISRLVMGTGTYSLTYTAVDTVGNVSTLTLTFTTIA